MVISRSYRDYLVVQVGCDGRIVGLFVPDLSGKASNEK